jgi:hypothetical protein
MHAGVFAAGPYCDAIVFGDQQSEQQHSMKTTGNVSIQTVDTEIGSVQEKYAVRQCAGREAAITVTCSLPAVANAAAPFAVLEVEEIHDRQWQTFGYSVLVNEKEVYFRTYEEQAAGPNHYFVRIEPDTVPDPGKIRITFLNRGNAPFRLSRAWLYADFFALADQEKIFQPLVVLGPGPFPPTKSSDVALGWFMDNEHMNYVYNGSYRIIDEVLPRIASYGVPAQVGLTAWFASCPGGPDGQGGYFSDPKYSQAEYRNGKLYPQYPNVWGNSFGYPSMSEPNINRFLDESREATCREIQRRLDFMKAAGKPLSQVQIMSDIGPFYENGADYSAFEVEAARRDGVQLDPTHRTAERNMWQFRHLTDVYARIAKAFRAGVQRDSVLVDRGAVTLPTDQLSENLYTHPWIRVAFPVGDIRWRGWQNGVVDGMWTTGEMGAGRQAIYDYITARGKIGIGNMYLGGVVPKAVHDTLVLQYQRGWRFAAPFGISTEAWNTLPSIDNLGDGRAVPPVHYERKALDVFIEASGLLGAPQTLLASENVQYGQFGGASGAIRVDPAKAGTLIYRLDTGEAEPATRATLFFQGHVPAKNVTFAVSDADGSWVEAGYPGNAQNDSSLNTIGGRGGAVSTLALPRLANGALPTRLKIDFTAGSIQRVRVGMNWDRLTGHTAAYRTAVTMSAEEIVECRRADETWLLASQHASDRAWTRKEARLLNLWIQQRRMTDLLMERYRKIVGQDAILREAEQCYQAGQYASAYRRLIGELSQCLPARYAVHGHGPLGRYPIQVQLPTDDDSALITISRMQPDQVDFTVDAEKPMACILTIGQLQQGRAYTLVQQGVNHYMVIQGARTGPDTTPLKENKGAVQATITIVPPAPAAPKHFAATFVARDGMKNIMEFWPTPTSTVAYSLKIFPNTCVLQRREVNGTTWKERTLPAPGDWCEVDLNEQGNISRIQSIYGVETGVIKSFERPGFSADAHAGILTLENGRRYELSWGVSGGTQLDTALLQGNPHHYNLDRLELGLRPGQRVDLTYTPSPPGARPNRIVRIHQSTKMIFEDKMDEDAAQWQTKPVEVSGIALRPNWLKKNSLFNKSSAFGHPGYVIYQLATDAPMGDTAVTLIGRTIIDERNKFKVFASLDRQTWVKCGEISSQEQLDQNHMNVDISSVAKGQKTCYLKVQIDGTGDWCILWGVQVRTERPITQE